ncbi:hypothetical protein [Roseibium album]|uniref:hypothetical protein n=1 Tax=Roseibium album TaxID=311410 RepID=UPI003BB078F5
MLNDISASIIEGDDYSRIDSLNNDLVLFPRMAAIEENGSGLVKLHVSIDEGVTVLDIKNFAHGLLENPRFNVVNHSVSEELKVLESSKSDYSEDEYIERKNQIESKLLIFIIENTRIKDLRIEPNYLLLPMARIVWRYFVFTRGET